MKLDKDNLSELYKDLPDIPSDIEISQNSIMKPIKEISKKLELEEDDLELYGKYKAKIEEKLWKNVKTKPDGKLILVTAITPTPAGEGKTCTSIGIAQAFGKLGVKHALAIREPSMGPTFGIKGGAAGGGYSQVLPMEDINIHFTGDLHAISSAHNLLSAVLDNSIHFENPLKIDISKIAWRRTIDLCDRQLRNGEIGLGSKFDGFPHMTGFDIVAASEIMTIMALADDINDLRERLGRIVVAYNTSGKPVFARDLNCIGALCVILKDALKPNLVQTCEHTPVFVHCGPFGNIAHGSNSVRATRLALKLAPYVLTEAGFAADLGAEKFVNIKCRQAGLKPNGAVLVATVRALKYHGGVDKDNLKKENIEALKNGCDNLRVHAENIGKFGLPLVVAINRFPTDSPSELEMIKQFCKEIGVESSLSEVVSKGGDGGIDLAKKIKRIVDENPGSPNFYYNNSDPIKNKIETVAREIYRADGVDFTEEAERSINLLEENKLDKLPICMAKTQSSLSDDPKKINAPKGWRLKVRDVKVSNGAGFIVALTGKMMLMPGMPSKSAVQKIDIDSNGLISGLS